MRSRKNGLTESLKSIGAVLWNQRITCIEKTRRAFLFSEVLCAAISEASEVAALATLAWFASAIHPGFADMIGPERFASDATAQINVGEMARHALWAYCEVIYRTPAGKSG